MRYDFNYFGFWIMYKYVYWLTEVLITQVGKFEKMNSNLPPPDPSLVGEFDPSTFQVRCLFLRLQLWEGY